MSCGVGVEVRGPHRVARVLSQRNELLGFDDLAEVVSELPEILKLPFLAGSLDVVWCGC